MIKILIVDDSKTEAKLLRHMFATENDFDVVGCAYDGKQAVEMTAALKPDVITMDLEMPIMDGHTATRLIMSQHPTPIVIISSKLDDTEVDMTFLALEAGAVSVLAKPINFGSENFEKAKQQIIATVRTMAEVKVIKRRFQTKPLAKNILYKSELSHKPGTFEIVGIGTSIGGPQILKFLLSQLPVDFPVPIVIVQHMTKGFMTGFTKWLNNHLSLPVKNAENKEELKKGHIYFAPDDYHLTVSRNNGKLMSVLTQQDPVSGFRPSITVMFDSIAKTSGNNGLGILLTGMGSDGAYGLLEIKKANGHTLIQDEKSCVVFGMGGVAQSLGAVDKIIDINKMAEYLIKMTLSNNVQKSVK